MSEITQKVQFLKQELAKISKKDITIMEVCGTHTMSLAKYAIRSLLPNNITILSGPGCPVCVTPAGHIQAAIDLAAKKDTIVATFGDLMKVPAGNDSLQNYPNVKICYSPMNAITIAEENPDKEVIFIGIGFETTTPLIAATVQAAKAKGVKNFSVLPLHKTVPVALGVILGSEGCNIDGLLLPGHVSAITGRRYYNFMDEYKVSGVIGGFDALQVMEAIYIMTKNINAEDYSVVNNHKTLVTENGNEKAFNLMFDIFEPVDSEWRGIGVIPASGLTLKKEYDDYNAFKKFNLEDKDVKDPAGCICGEILMGKSRPVQCKHFGKTCTPSNPVGPCMVSSEGTCAAYFKYNVL